MEECLLRSMEGRLTGLDFGDEWQARPNAGGDSKKTGKLFLKKKTRRLGYLTPSYRYEPFFQKYQNVPAGLTRLMQTESNRKVGIWRTWFEIQTTRQLQQGMRRESIRRSYYSE